MARRIRDRRKAGADPVPGGNPDTATEPIEATSGNRTEDAGHWLALARASELAERTEDALTACRRAAACDPSPAGMTRAAGALFRLGRYADALQYLETSVEQKRSVSTLNLLALVLHALGRNREAEEALEKARTLDASNRLSACLTGVVLAAGNGPLFDPEAALDSANGRVWSVHLEG